MSGVRVQDFPSASGIETWLKDHSGMPPVNRQSLASAVSALLPTIDLSHKTTIGIAGAPGSGKSTFSRTLAHSLQVSGVLCCVLSLDNYYLSLSRRERLARNRHPGFLQRGVPGTHDLEWMLADLDRLLADRATGTYLPVFDKSTDDLAPESQWQRVQANPQVILVEGWCIGSAPPESTAKNGLRDGEQINNDSDEAWLEHVDQAWRHLYLELRKRLQQVWYIQVPDWDCVVNWRWQQERDLPKRRLSNRRDVAAFLTSFRGIFHHMQATCTDWADRVLITDRGHNFHLPD